MTQKACKPCVLASFSVFLTPTKPFYEELRSSTNKQIMSKISQNEAKISANDQFKHYNGTEQYYKYKMGLYLTDGSKAMADEFQCYWLLDVIMSYQHRLKEEEFQVWTLEKKFEGKAIVRCTDGDGKELVKQNIAYTDFKAEWATLWVENSIILLPTER